MPEIDAALIPLNKIINLLTEEEYILVNSILKKGRLKNNKPKIEYTYVQNGNFKLRTPEKNSGEVAYLWAKVAYNLSPFKCNLAQLPDARFYLSFPAYKARLDEIADLICNITPTKYHYGKIARGE